MAKKDYSVTCKGCGAVHIFKVVDGEVKHVYKPKADGKPKDDKPDAKTGSRHTNDDDPNKKSPFEDFLSGTGAFASDDQDSSDEDDDKTDDDEDE